MKQTLRQIVAILALGGIALSLVPNALAAAYSPEAAANKLAVAGYIVDKSATPADYRLGATLTRAEATKVVGKGRGVLIEPVKTTGCTSRFSDVLPGTWECAVIEIAADTGLTKVDSGSAFRPMASLSKYEAMAFAFRSACTEVPTGTGPAAMATIAADAGIITNAAAWNPTAVATRGEFFMYVAVAMEDSSCEDIEDEDALCTLFPALCEDPVDPPVVTGGDVEVTLSDDTAESADLPLGAEGIAVASFDIAAGDTDVTVSSIKLTRRGLGASTAVLDVALFANGGRVSKAKTFNSSNDTAEVVLSPALVVEAGDTVTVTAKVTTTTVSGNVGTFAIELTDMVSTADALDGTPVVGNEFEVKSSPTATAVTVDDDSSVVNPKLGTLQAELLKFKVSATTTNHEDVTLSEITLKEDGGIDESTELDNVALYYNGTKVADGVSNDSKFFTFALDDEIVVKEGKTEKFVVKGDVVGGAGETINFVLDNDLDVTATASKYGYVSITDSLAGSVLTVQAGEVTLVQIDPTSTEIRRDKDNVVLGSVKIVSKAGKTLELEKFRVTIENQDSSTPANVSALLENIELYDATAGTVYDLTRDGAASTSETYSEEVNIAFPSSGEMTLTVRADTQDVSVDGAKLVASLSYDTTSTSTAGTFAIKETGDDKYVTDVTPSAISFKAVNGSTSALSINTVAMSATKSAVIGSKAVETLTFELKSDNDASDIMVDELKVTGVVVDNASSATITVAGVDEAVNPAAGNVVITKGDTTSDTIAVDLAATDNTDAEVATAIAAAIDADSDYSATASAGVVTIVGPVDSIVTTSLVAAIAAATTTDDVTLTAAFSTNNGTDTLASNSRISAVYLYNGTTLLDQVSGSNLASGVATFDGLSVKVPKNSSVRLTVKVDILDATAQANDTLRFSLTGYSAEDEDGDDVYSTTPADVDGVLAITDVRSARIVSIKGAGSLAATADNTDSATANDKNVLGGVTSPFVASYELVATNEGVLVKDFQLDETSGATLSAAVEEVIVYANDKTTEIDRQAVTSDTVLFNNANFTVDEGSANIYVKVVAAKQGKDQAGAQTADYQFKLTVTDAEGAASNKVVANPAQSANSNKFSVLPVKVSAVSMVQTGGGASLANTLSNGTSQVLGIIAVTSDSSVNTDSTDGSALKTALQALQVTIEGGLAIADMKITRVGGSDSDGQAATGGTTNPEDKDAGDAVMDFALSSLTNEDGVVDNGTTVYYKIEGKPTLTGTDSESVAIKVAGLNSGSLTYKSDDAVTNNTTVTELRLGYTEVSGLAIKE